jgi:hypothetical protein
VAQLYPRALGSIFRLLRLAGLRWRYSNPPPHGSNTHLGPAVNISHSLFDYLLDSFGFVDVVTRSRVRTFQFLPDMVIAAFLRS